MHETLSILYEDEHIVAIHKPHDLLVHRSSIAADAEEFALQLLRDQIDCYVYPIHRLDRKTSGVLLFAKSAEIASALGDQLMSHQCTKIYHAIVRGYFPESDIHLDYTLTDYKGRKQEAQTDFKLLSRYEIDVPFGAHETSRYSLVECRPTTGRYHQIRKHLAHLRHPIIADRPHGCNKQNKLWKEKWGMTTMLLQAMEMHITHPMTDERLMIKSSYSSSMSRVLALLTSN